MIMRVDEIERYLAKEMPYPEREAFEAEMAKDPALLLDVRLLACVMQKTRDVCRDFDKWAAQRLSFYKHVEEEMSRYREDSSSEDLTHFAAESMALDSIQHTMCCRAYDKEVLSQLDEKESMAFIDDIRSDKAMSDMVQKMMVVESGTSIYHIVEQSIIHYGKVYSGMKVYDWVDLVSRYVKEVTCVDDIEPYEYFVCSIDKE